MDNTFLTTPLAIRAYKTQSLGAMRFIGKKYSSEKEARDEWQQKGLCEILEKHLKGVHKDFYEDGDAPVGLMSIRAGFEYWLGYFTPEGTTVPEGFELLPDCGDWWIERYSHNRCIPDKMGYAISDICFFVK